MSRLVVGARRRPRLWLGVSIAVLALVAPACSSTSGGSSSQSSTTPAANTSGYNAGATSVVNPSNAKGGTLTFGLNSTPDSTDPGNTYSASIWDFSRLYAMPLLTYGSCPGKCGLNLVPDLATGLGVVSSDGLSWTYHIQPNVHFEDGSLVTSKDVKYAVERTFDRKTFPDGPDYFAQLLAPQKPAYTGPYTDKTPGHLGLKSVTTPDATTIVFHLAQPFVDFNYIAALPQSAPVPSAVDLNSKTGGANYQLHPVSTGPYEFQSYDLNKQITLVRNPHWNPATNPIAKQLADKIVVTLNLNSDDIDNRLLAGDLDVDLGGTGLQTAAQAKTLTDPKLKADDDDPVSGYDWLYYINTRVAPLNNVACRRAIEYAADKTTLQTALGGPVAGGDIASTVAPPTTVGYKQFDLYEALTKPGGDIAKAKAALAACGHPHGFTTNIAYRSDRPKEVATATALQQSLRRVGIMVQLRGFPSGTYFSDFIGVPAYVHSHDLGLSFAGYGADWPTGYGFFDYLADGNTISPSGNSNVEELNDPVVNQLLAKAAATSDAATRNGYTSQIDRQVMRDAAILPVTYPKVLLYRPPALTNVYIQPYFHEYNYAVLGLKQ